MTMMAVLKWNSIYMYTLYILFWWDPLGFFRPSCMFGEVFLDLLGQAWILPLKEDMMCVLIVSFGKVKQSETFCILQNHTNPPFSFLNLWFREKMRKGCLFFELFSVWKKKPSIFLVGSISISIAQAVPTSRGKSHHRSTTDDPRHAKSTEPWHLKWKTRGRMEMAYMFGMYAVDTSTYVWVTCGYLNSH